MKRSLLTQSFTMYQTGVVSIRALTRVVCSSTRNLQSSSSTLDRFRNNKKESASSADNEPASSEEKKTPENFFDFNDGDWGFKEDLDQMLKVNQRFSRDPAEWPQDEAAFGVTESTFVGKTIDKVELRPERAFANFVPIGMMGLRHMYRAFRAKVYYVGYKETGVFEAPTVVSGAKKAFEVISQAAHKDDLNELVRMSVCNEETAERFTLAGSHMSPRQRGLFNLTEDDIFGVAPGVLGPFQNIQQRVSRDKEMIVAYSVLVCAYYKKKLLYDAVKDVPLLKGTPEELQNCEKLRMPTGYGYKSPRIVFGYLTFANKIAGPKMLDSEVKLHDFQYLIF